MTFEAYIINIKTKTGCTPADFRARARKLGLLAPGAKAAPLVAWLKREFGLGHGHAMAVWASFKRNGWVAGNPAPNAGPSAPAAGRVSRAGTRA